MVLVNLLVPFVMSRKFEVFRDLSDEETLYWLGFIATDGCIEELKGCPQNLSVKLQVSDWGHLEKLKSYMGTKANVRPKKDKSSDCCVLVIGGKNSFVPRLVNLGITPRKSYTLQVHSELAKSRHFWRGALDGDGHIKYHKYFNGKYHCNRFKLNLASMSPRFLDQFEYYCNYHLQKEFGKPSRWENDRGFGAVEYQGRRVLDIANHFYDNSSIMLPRKIETLKLIKP